MQPFPYIFIKNIFDEKYVDKLNSFLPSYKNLKGKEILFQSKSKIKKKKLYCQVQLYKKLSKNEQFKILNKSFKYLKPIIVEKFKKKKNM